MNGRTSRHLVLVLSLVALLTVPMAFTVGAARASPVPSAPVPGAGTPIHSGALSLGSSLGSHYNTLYGVVFGDNLPPPSLAGIGAYYNSTPISWFRLSGGGDGYDPTTQTNYVPPPSGTGKYVLENGSFVNFSWFKAWCYSRTPHCNWMTYLPGEENNTTAAVHTALWFHHILGFVPTVWEFGNEPTSWTHYGKNRTAWATSDRSTPSSMDYAVMVRNYMSAVGHLFPGDRYLGVQAACSCEPGLISTLAWLDGPRLTGMAYHDYPAISGSTTNVSQFLGELQSSTNILNTTNVTRSLIQLGCSRCTGLPVSLGEYQSGPVPTLSPLASTFAGAPFLAASVIQAIEANDSTLTLFDNNWLFSSSNGSLRPQGLLYQRILENMTMGQDFAVTVHITGVGGLYALLVTNGTRESLLFVNTNATYSVGLSIPKTLFPVGGTGSIWRWSPGSLAPGDRRSTLLPLTYAVPAEGILLLTNY